MCGDRLKDQDDFFMFYITLVQPLVHKDSERGNEAYDYTFPTGISIFVKSCSIPLALPMQH